MILGRMNLQFQRPNNASLPSRSLTASEAIERTGVGNAVNMPASLEGSGGLQ